jgi:hypothetical protein
VSRLEPIAADATAIVLGGDPSRQALTRAQAERRVEEFAAGLVALDCRRGDRFALPSVADGEALLLAMAAIEVGLAIVFGDGPAPPRSGLRITPDEEADTDPRFPLLRPLDDGRSLDQLAAHGVLHIALEPDLRPRRTAERQAGDVALIVPGAATLDLQALWAAIRALHAVEDLLRPEEPILFARPLDAPWVLALALAAYAVGAPIAFGDATTLRAAAPGVIVHGALLAESLPALLEEDQSRRGYLERLRRARVARTVGPGATLIPRLVLADVGDLSAEDARRIHAAGPLPLRLATAAEVAGPALLNRPALHRSDALGLPLPEHRAEIVEGCVRITGPAVAGPTRTTDIGIPGRMDGDGLVFPAPEASGD